MYEKKVETNYVIEGGMKFFYKKKMELWSQEHIRFGDGWCVPLKTKHRVILTTDYTS